jgi:hypothetical protein
MTPPLVDRTALVFAIRMAKQLMELPRQWARVKASPWVMWKVLEWDWTSLKERRQENRSTR